MKMKRLTPARALAGLMLFAVLAMVLLPVIFMSAARADTGGIEFLHWAERTDGRRVMDEYVPRLTWQHAAPLSHGFTYARKNYLGVGLYDGHTESTGQPLTAPTAYVGSQNELAYHAGPVKATLGADGWFRTTELWLTTYARLGIDVQVGRTTIDAGVKHGLKTWQNPLLSWRSDTSGTGDPTFKPVSHATTPYLAVTYALRPGWSVRAYYDAYRFGQSPDRAGGWYQPASRMDVIGVMALHRF